MNQLTVSSKINLLTLLDAPSENNEYEEDEFEDENALGIQNLDDEDNDYDDEQFEQWFDDAEDLRRHQTASSKRPVSK